MLVKIEMNPDGSHTFLSVGRMDSDWAYVPETISIPETFPFVDIRVENVKHDAVVQTRKRRHGSVIFDETVTVQPAFTRLEVVSKTASQPVEEETQPEQLSMEERMERLEMAIGVIKSDFATHFGTSI